MSRSGRKSRLPLFARNDNTGAGHRAVEELRNGEPQFAGRRYGPKTIDCDGAAGTDDVLLGAGGLYRAGRRIRNGSTNR